jgi:hypothetical protein
MNYYVHPFIRIAFVSSHYPAIDKKPHNRRRKKSYLYAYVTTIAKVTNLCRTGYIAVSPQILQIPVDGLTLYYYALTLFLILGAAGKISHNYKLSRHGFV